MSVLTKEEQIKKRTVEIELYEHYRKICHALLNNCIYKLNGMDPRLDAIALAFGIDKKDLTLKAFEEELNKWKKADGQTS